MREARTEKEPGADFPATPFPEAEGIGSKVGRYTLLEPIGEGGFGAVYRAEQREPLVREVAVKIIKQGMDTRQVIARFEAERQALALMDHPNIAKVLDAGATATGRPYFAMELVRGVPLIRFCDEHRLDTRQRLELFMDVCAAVQHAHQKGIIHRDLKPSNILVGLEGDQPVAKVIDFGIAKATEQMLTDKTLFTCMEQFIGTPLYIAPEQAEGSAADVDTRADIYSLGVILYELLTGKPPLDRERVVAAGFDEIRRMIRETDAPKPSTRLVASIGEDARRIAAARQTEPRKLGHFLRGDLDWIVLKAIEKERERRYDTANALRLDIGRFLNDEPVSAAAPSSLYRFRKFARRRRGPLAAGAAILLALVAGAVVSIQQGIRATKEARRTREALVEAETARHAAESARDTAEDSLYRMEILRAQQDLDDDRVAAVRQLLDRHVPGAGGKDRRGWEWYYLNSLMRQSDFSLQAGQGRLGAVAWSPDGRRFASAGQSGSVKIWDGYRLEVLQTLAGNAGMVTALAWNPVKPELLASAGVDHSIILWDLRSGVPKWRHALHDGEVLTLAWHPDGTMLASGGMDHSVVLTEAESGLELLRRKGRYEVHGLAWHPDVARLVADGKLPDESSGVLAACFDRRTDFRSVALWSCERREGSPDRPRMKLLKRLATRAGWAETIDWSADGRFLAGFAEASVSVWEDPLGDARQVVETVHRGNAGVMDWHPREPLLATASDDQTIKVWKPELKSPLSVLNGHRGRVTGIAWHPSGETLLSCSDDGTVQEWSPSLGADRPALFKAPFWIRQADWSPDGSVVAAAFWRGTVPLVNPSTGEVERSLVGHRNSVPWVKWCPDGKRIATAGFDGTVRIWDASTTETLTVLDHDEAQGMVAWNADGSQLASRSWWVNDQQGKDAHKVTVWNLAADGAPVSHFVIRDSDRNDEAYAMIAGIAWSPDNSCLVTGGFDGSITVRDPMDGAALQRVPAVVPGIALWIAWDPSGRRLVLAGSDGHLVGLPFNAGRIGEPLFTKQAFTGEFPEVVWSPDGSRLAGCGADGTIKVIDPATGVRMLTLHHSDATGDYKKVATVAWSPDGRKLVSGGADMCLRLWDASAGYEVEGSVRRAGRRASGNASAHDGPERVEDRASEAASPPARKVHHYTFNDGTFTDRIGGLDGELKGAATIGEGALQLSGGTGELDAGALAIRAYHSLSIEFWATSDTTANTDFHVLFGMGEVHPTEPGFASNYVMLAPDRGDDMIRGAIATNNSKSMPWIYEAGVSTPRHKDGKQHHYVLTISEPARKLELFVDGVSVGKAPTRQKLADVATKVASIGLLYPKDPPWQGSVNELAIYEGVLTPAEVAKAYADGPMAGAADPGE